MVSKPMLNLCILAFAFMLVFTSFQTGGIIQATVLASVQKQDPNFKADGYTSLAIIYTLFALFNWMAPTVISLVGPRLAMFIGALTYLLFIASFLYPLTWLLYLLSGVLGWGAAVIWTAQGHYLSINAGPENMARHSGIFWAILQSSMLLGNLFIAFTFEGNEIDKGTRLLTYGVLTGVAAIGVLLFLLLRPAAQRDGQVNVEKPTGPLTALLNAGRLFFKKEQILFSVCYIYTGLELSFYSGVYGTCIASTVNLPNAKKLLGISGMLIGAGEIIGGLVFGLLGKKTVRWGRHPVVCLGMLIHLVAFGIIFINLPDSSSLGKNTTDEAIIKSNAYLAILSSFLIGLADSLFNTQIFAAIGTIFADDTASGFAVFKFVQSAASAVAFFYSSHVTLYWQLLILVVSGLIGTACYVAAEISVARRIPRL